ncbi:YfhO family protein [bacterium 210820-DFI.6.37]|nr:YfhO family protein [bacterium 210820-DFI.6.37]
MLQKGKRFCYHNRYIFLAFFVPFFLMLAACAAAGFYPFGENQVAVIDMYHQYFPFINELHEKLQTGGSLLYTWNGGMGTNFLSLLSYYAASPLYFFTIFVPDAYLMEAVTVIIFIKIGLAGAFMAIFLRGVYGRCDCAAVAFSTLYSLCAYVMGYYWCLMWLDTVALLPLCVLGLNRLLDRGAIKLYTLSIAALMITNYYTGGMVCIFILFYYPVLYFSQAERRGAAGCLRVTGKAVLCSVTGIFIAAFTLLPTFLNMQSSYYIDSEMPADTVFYNPLLDILTNLLPQTQLTVREGLPNIYCGLLSVMMLVFYLLIKEIPLRKKLLNCGLLAFLILSLNWNKLDFIWHGMHFPNQLPYRYSFVVSFLLVTLAWEAFLRFRSVSPRQVAAVAAAGTGWILMAQKFYGDEFSPEFAYVCLLLLFIYSGFLAVYRTGKQSETLMCVLLLVLTAGEMMSNTDTAVQTVSYTNRAEYFAESQDVRTLAKEIQKKDRDFYRIEVANPLILNSPMLYNYPGVSEFSSAVSGDMSYFMERIGLEAENVKNRYNYVMTTPVANAMLGVKYIISRGQQVSGEPSLSLAGGEELTCLYENRYFLSAGYMADSAVLHGWDYQQDNPFSVLNDFVKIAADTQDTVFHRIGVSGLSASGAALGSYKNGFVSCVYETGTAEAELTFVSPEDQQVYVFVETDGAESITARNQQGNSVQLKEDCGAVVSLGSCKAGETITIHITYEEGKAGDITAHVYGMDPAAWDRAYSALADETLKVEDHGDTFLEGTIAVKKDGCFVTSIPYEKGWKLEVDGEERETEAFGDAFIAVPLEAGEHEIRLTYMPDGFLPGVLVSLCGIGSLMGLCLIRRRRRSEPEEPRQKGMSETSGGEIRADFPNRRDAGAPEVNQSGPVQRKSRLRRRRFL